MPVETKCSPIFTIGPFVDHHGPWVNGNSKNSKFDTPDPPVDEGGGGGGATMTSTLEKLKLANGIGCKSFENHINSSNSTSPSSPQPPTPHQNGQSNITTTTTLTTNNNAAHQDIHEKPALPPRPSHLQSSSSNHRRRLSSNNGTAQFPFQTNLSSPRDRLSPSSPPLLLSPVTSEKEYIERIAKLQMDNLIPLKEDVSGKMTDLSFCSIRMRASLPCHLRMTKLKS